MSLANVLAVSQAAKSVVLIGDPQQLEQPMQGSHPEGTDVSALDHILGEHATIPPDRGLFLEETWRLHPAICAFTSELFYEGRLQLAAGLERQIIKSSGRVSGSRLALPAGRPPRAIRTARPRRRTSSAALVDGDPELGRDMGRSRRQEHADHARRHPDHHALQRAGLRAAGAPAGRARRHGRQVPGPGSADRDLLHGDVEPCRCAARHGVPLQPEPAQRRDVAGEVPVRSGRLAAVFEAECRTPRQMQLANAFCRYLEMATVI